MALTHLDLNVWRDGSRWKMAIYSVIDGITDTANYRVIKATPDRVVRYLQISTDEDWWTANLSDDFYYILWGERILPTKKGKR